ncbi:hypothetical protein DH2020_045265 [Rehmannia glutinosa]|uniref:Phytosulfokine n=1 Tax=Rehmannia glutinosa TaxID=99300 RepID=A0ABR0UEL8_REHGL
MAKIASLTIITLLLFLTLAHLLAAARPEPTFHDVTPMETHSTDHNVEVDEDSCGEVGEEECMTRRTLQAHLDYIYTQNQNQP